LEHAFVMLFDLGAVAVAVVVEVLSVIGYG
jgi:hypothetical protein